MSDAANQREPGTIARGVTPDTPRPPAHQRETSVEAMVLVACIGSSVVCDDRVGEAVYQRLRGLGERLPPGTRVLNLGVGGTDLVEALRAEDLLIVVDALRIGALPGTVAVIDWDELSGSGPTAGGISAGDTSVPGALSVHDVGVPQALELTRLLYPERVPRRTVLVGVQGRCFDCLGPMTPEVAAAIDEVTETIVELVRDACRSAP